MVGRNLLHYRSAAREVSSLWSQKKKEEEGEQNCRMQLEITQRVVVQERNNLPSVTEGVGERLVIDRDCSSTFLHGLSLTVRARGLIPLNWAEDWASSVERKSCICAHRLNIVPPGSFNLQI